MHLNFLRIIWLLLYCFWCFVFLPAVSCNPKLTPIILNTRFGHIVLNFQSLLWWTFSSVSLSLQSVPFPAPSPLFLLYILLFYFLHPTWFIICHLQTAIKWTKCHFTSTRLQNTHEHMCILQSHVWKNLFVCISETQRVFAHLRTSLDSRCSTGGRLSQWQSCCSERMWS